MSHTRAPADAAMSAPRPARTSRTFVPPTKPSGPPQLLLMELKHRILSALSKLADRDTQHIAAEDLDKILETLPPDCVSACLSCLYDSDVQQKSVVKKECIRLFGMLASIHGDLISPHLPKILASIVRRLRDPDTCVRDACVDTIGLLSGRFLCWKIENGSGMENGVHANLATMLTAFVKPLFDALSEQNKGVQTGAALCLGRLVETAKDPPPTTMQRLCLRLSKFLGNPNFLAKAALLPVFGSLSQVGAISQQHLALLMPSMKEALESNDWATRKAAAETLGRLVVNLGPVLKNFKDSILLVLESCRFDKVKPVRDSIQETIQLWKNLPGSQMDGPGGNIATCSDDLILSAGNLNLKSPSSTSSETASVVEVPKASDTAANVNSNQKSRKMAENFVLTKKRIPILTDRKPNFQFFQKLEAQNSDDWQIEVAVPRKCPQPVSMPLADENKFINEREVLTYNAQMGMRNIDRLVDGSLLKDDAVYSHREEILEKRLREYDSHSGSADVRVNSSNLDGNAAVSSLGNHNSEAWQSERTVWSDDKLLESLKDNSCWDAGVQLTNSTSGKSYKEGHERRWLLLQSQLSQMENQQSGLMEMLQDFMSSSQETMFALEARVLGLERLVEELAQKLPPPSGMNLVHGTGYDGGGVKFYGRQVASDAARLREYTWKGSSDIASEDWASDSYGSGKSNPLGSLIDGQAGSRRGNAGACSNGRASKNDIGDDQMKNRKGWDRMSGPTRLGEGPSARSVWQASKDEATLAAIRVVAEDARVLETEAQSSEVSELITVNPSESVPYKAEGQEKRQLWILWSCIMEHVRAGDIDSAYGEVLCSADDLMLVRLMSKTGPVLEQLSANTVTEMLRSLVLLLQQRSFFDFLIPWVQQVVDMIAENGPNCFAISCDVKKELLLSLQEVSSMDMPEGWVGNTVDEFLEQLANAWSADLMHNDHDQA